MDVRAMGKVASTRGESRGRGFLLMYSLLIQRRQDRSRPPTYRGRDTAHQPECRLNSNVGTCTTLAEQDARQRQQREIEARRRRTKDRVARSGCLCRVRLAVPASKLRDTAQGVNAMSLNYLRTHQQTVQDMVIDPDSACPTEHWPKAETRSSTDCHRAPRRSDPPLAVRGD